MEKEFVPYELALRMKQLGFDEECFYVKPLNGNTEFFYTPSDYDDFPEQKEVEVGMPLFQQAFRWFREKYKLNQLVTRLPKQYVGVIDSEDGLTHLFYQRYDTYREAELACLEKLIEIVEQKQ